MLKYSVAIILYTYQQNDKGQYPIYLRITINRQRSYISTGHYIEERFWEKKAERVKDTHMQAGAINPDIATRKQAVIKKLVDYQVKGETVTSAKLKTLFTQGINEHNIFEFAELFIQEVQHKRRPGTLENYRKHLKVVELFHGSRSLAFEEVDNKWLTKFENHLRKTVGGNYIYIIWKTLKTFYNAAKKRGVITCYPFGTYENPKYTAPIKDYLTLAELDKIEMLTDKTTNATLKQVATYFLLGCYSGLRISDWRQFNYDQHVKDERIYLRAGKNGEWVTMPVIGRLKKHLQRVKEIPLTLEEPVINRHLKKMAGIEKRISSHTGRHTFAVTMCSEKGISLEVCATLMGITVSVCEKNYYSVTPKKIEDEVKKKWK